MIYGIDPARIARFAEKHASEYRPRPKPSQPTRYLPDGPTARVLAHVNSVTSTDYQITAEACGMDVREASRTLSRLRHSGRIAELPEDREKHGRAKVYGPPMNAEPSGGEDGR